MRSRWLVLAAGCSLLLSLDGCFHYRLAPVSPDGEALPPATEPQSETVWSFAWGLAQPTVQPANCMGNGAAEVTTTTNLGFALLTVITIGLVAPAEVEWRCARDAPAAGNDF
jgi:Bor protein